MKRFASIASSFTFLLLLFSLFFSNFKLTKSEEIFEFPQDLYVCDRDFYYDVWCYPNGLRVLQMSALPKNFFYFVNFSLENNLLKLEYKDKYRVWIDFGIITTDGKVYNWSQLKSLFPSAKSSVFIEKRVFYKYGINISNIPIQYQSKIAYVYFNLTKSQNLDWKDITKANDKIIIKNKIALVFSDLPGKFTLSLPSKRMVLIGNISENIVNGSLFLDPKVTLLPSTTHNKAYKTGTVDCSNPSAATTELTDTDYNEINQTDGTYDSHGASARASQIKCTYGRYTFNISSFYGSIENITFYLVGYYSGGPNAGSSVYYYNVTSGSWVSFEGLTSSPREVSVFFDSSNISYIYNSTSGLIQFGDKGDTGFDFATHSVTVYIDSVNLTIFYSDTQPPRYSLNSTNSTLAGSPVEHSLYWQDDFGLSGYVFQFCNGTWNGSHCLGSWLNDTWQPFTSNMCPNPYTECWSNATKIINSTGGAKIAWCVYTNDTSNNWNSTSCENPFSYVTTTYLGYLEVEIPSPPLFYTIEQNKTFWVNATVTCRQGNCGEVSGTVRYNSSSPNPDEAINTTQGAEPFYVVDSWNNFLNTGAANQISCGTLDQDQTCTLSWLVNATGAINSYWKIGVLFNSSLTEVEPNHTANSTIHIVECIESLSLAWTSIDFGQLIPDTPASSNPAPGNANKLYNITNTGTCDLKLWIKGTDLQNSTLNSVIKVGNLTWSNYSSVYDPSYVYNLDYSYTLLSSSLLTPNSNLTTYYWLAVPPVYSGKYKGTITICGNYSSLCD